MVGFPFERFGWEVLGWLEDEGVDEPCREFKVEEDCVVETVAADRSEFLELFEGFSVFGSVFLRLRSLKKGMVLGQSDNLVFSGFSKTTTMNLILA